MVSGKDGKMVREGKIKGNEKWIGGVGSVYSHWRRNGERGEDPFCLFRLGNNRGWAIGWGRVGWV